MVSPPQFLRHWSLFSQSLLPALGVLAALAAAERLASRLRLQSDRIWTAAVLGGICVFAGERLLLIFGNWRAYLAHPFWMLGLRSVRDERLFYAGILFASLVCVLYLLSRRIPLLRAAEALLPAGSLLLAFVHAGYLLAGAEPGKTITAHWAARWSITYGDRTAHALYGTPLHVPLNAVAAYAAVGYALLALAGAALAARGRSSAGLTLLGDGLLAVLLGQLQLRLPGAPMILNTYSWAQAAGVLSALGGAGLLLRA